MATARWDLTWQRGGAWQRTIVRRDAKGEALGIGQPCLLEVRGVDQPSTQPPVLIVNAVIPADGRAALLTVTRDTIETLTESRYQHRLLVTDLITALPLVLARGWVSINDHVGG